MAVRIIVGDCRERMAEMEPASVDAIVTDPPYGLEFMGKEWDKFSGAPRRIAGTGGTEAPFAQSAVALTPKRNREFGAWSEAWCVEAYRVLKPGGHLLAFGGTRTHHRLMVAIEDAGFEIRDCLMWLYGSGFPKSLDVSKAIDKAAGFQRESDYLPNDKNDVYGGGMGGGRTTRTDPPATDAAREWDGWGTALKPAWEPVIMARKPLAGTVASNVLTHGTGALNIGGCRIDSGERPNIVKHEKNGKYAGVFAHGSHADGSTTQGRWPANVVLDEDAAAMLDAQSGTKVGGHSVGANPADYPINNQIFGKFDYDRKPFDYADTGGASRFFYTAKASRSERNKGLDGLPVQELKGFNASPREGHGEVRNSNHYGNHHPTVKPLDLMQWLVRLVTPPGGTVLDPFAGSGSTLVAADREGFNAIGIELDPEYAEIARRRVFGDAPLFAEVLL